MDKAYWTNKAHNGLSTSVYSLCMCVWLCTMSTLVLKSLRHHYCCPLYECPQDDDSMDVAKHRRHPAIPDESTLVVSLPPAALVMSFPPPSRRRMFVGVGVVAFGAVAAL
mmetsp:Transcript_24353/g.55866  ORF Transcript_24353/g.55866 Transcript_24353/m.55866 type:complete len:110 (-) Transcript_24353:1529-1858(-)